MRVRPLRCNNAVTRFAEPQVCAITQVCSQPAKLPVNITAISALPADEIAFWKRQEHAVYSRIIFGTVQEICLDAG